MLIPPLWTSILSISPARKAFLSLNEPIRSVSLSFGVRGRTLSRETLAACCAWCRSFTHNVKFVVHQLRGQLQIPEFCSRAVRGWLERLGAGPLFIEPGSPWENGYNESFNGKLRDERLDREIFYTLEEAKVLIEDWRREHNTERPHSSLGYWPPAPEALVSAAQGGLDLTSLESGPFTGGGSSPRGQLAGTVASPRAPTPRPPRSSSVPPSLR
jgi:hypothetical protein